MGDRYDNANLIHALTTEWHNHVRNGIYGQTSKMMAYNSNKIEGSTLTPEQTATLFDYGRLSPADQDYRAKDIEEMQGHFLMFNRMLETLDEPLTEDLIKSFHYELKSGVFEDRANEYRIEEMIQLFREEQDVYSEELGYFGLLSN